MAAVTVLALAWLVAAAAPATAESGSAAFTETGEHTFVVPPAVTSLRVKLIGGTGEQGNQGAPGGIGATVLATIAVSPGETLYGEVAGNGEAIVPGAASLGGYGGGGTGGLREFLFASGAGGGGGGGASDVRTCSATGCGQAASLASRLVVAGGGGGGGGLGDPESVSGGNGANAGYEGFSGQRSAFKYEGGSGGGAGTSSAGGDAGAPSEACPLECAVAGSLGSGGTGGSAIRGGGGGGGGGLYGGGGGGGGEATLEEPSPGNLTCYNGGGGGGGGGSSGIPAGAVGVGALENVPTAPGSVPQVVFTWTAPPPTVATSGTGSLTSVTAVLEGTVNPNLWTPLSCVFDVSPAPDGVAGFPCAQQLSALGSPVAVSTTAVGLTPATAYTFTLTAATVAGQSTSTALSFVTPAAGVPAGNPCSSDHRAACEPDELPAGQEPRTPDGRARRASNAPSTCDHDQLHALPRRDAHVQLRGAGSRRHEGQALRRAAQGCPRSSLHPLSDDPIQADGRRPRGPRRSRLRRRGRSRRQAGDRELPTDGDGHRLDGLEHRPGASAVHDPALTRLR